MAKKLLAAGYIRDMKFDTEEEMEKYLTHLQRRKQYHKVLEISKRNNRSVIVRVLQQYNNTRLIQL